MDDINILVAIAMFMAGIFGMAGLRLWFITHQDVNMSKKVNGLSIDMGKIKKRLNDGLMPVQTQPQGNVAGNIETTMDVANMTLEDAAEMLGIDKNELNSPIFRPIAEKIFNSFKEKAITKQDDDTHPPLEML